VPLLRGVPCLKESLDKLQRNRRADDPPAQNQHVYVVVFHSLMGRVVIVAEPRADTANLVGRNGRAYAASTDKNTSLGFAVAYGKPDGFGMALHYLQRVPGVIGGVVVIGERIGVAGGVEIAG